MTLALHAVHSIISETTSPRQKVSPKAEPVKAQSPVAAAQPAAGFKRIQVVESDDESDEAVQPQASYTVAGVFTTQLSLALNTF